jgi:CRISPR/Cas system-associated exonuclease Cas4 (RecB family)
MVEMRPWSYSNLEKFETCPRQYYELKVAKSIVEPEGEAAKWGKLVHSAFEYRIRDKVPLPAAMQKWEPFAKKIEALPGQKFCELEVALDASYQPTEWAKAWTRGVIDFVGVAGSTAVVIDYKTGKRKPSEQLRLYAAYIFALHPEVNKVSTGFAWLQSNKLDREMIQREELPVVWRGFIERAARLKSAFDRESWPERPSGLCNGWCPVKQCRHYKPKR